MGYYNCNDKIRQNIYKEINILVDPIIDLMIVNQHSMVTGPYVYNKLLLIIVFAS